ASPVTEYPNDPGSKNDDAADSDEKRDEVGKASEILPTRPTLIRPSCDSIERLISVSDSSTVNDALLCSPGKMKPPIRRLISELVSRRGMKTPSRVTPCSSSHNTAMRWAAFSLFMPMKPGKTFGLMCSRRIRQMPAMARPSYNFGLKRDGKRRCMTDGSTR